MDAELSVRDKRITEWWFQETLGHSGQLPKGNFMLVYMKTLIDVTAADGVLTKSERDWILGFASTSGKILQIIHQQMIVYFIIYSRT